MGTLYSSRCNSCGATFETSEGGGFLFELLHCEACGKEKSVPLDELGGTRARRWGPRYVARIEGAASACECGGHFRLNAPPRCPVCRSTDLTNFATICYD
jgi:hypothetical protein